MADWLGHANGGRSALGYYTAWVDEADQRASHILMTRLPHPHAARHQTRARHSTGEPIYQAIAADLRIATTTGALPPGSTLSTLQQPAATHHITPSTAHRAIADLAREHLVTVSRGRRAVATTAPDRVILNSE